MVAIVTFAVMIATVVALFVYSIVHKPQPGDYYPDGASSPELGGSISFSAGPSPPRARRSRATPAPPTTPPTYTPRYATAPAASIQPPPPKLRRAILSSDPTEHTLLAQIRERPADPETRMVYADLLEGRGEAAKASFVRGTARYEDVVDVLKTSDVGWRALVSRERTQHCTSALCPHTWDAFEPTPDDERQRSCRACDKMVRYCANREEEIACPARDERGVLDVGGALPIDPKTPSS